MKDKFFTKKTFPIILGLAAFLIAMCAAFFSVYGISTLFSGAFISAIIMASSLELGKLVGVTFLYRYWTKCTVILKSYLVCASLILMVITSLGIFGYLSAAYQKSAIEFSVIQEKIKNTENQKPFINDKISSSKKRIEELIKLRTSQDNQMSSIITNEFIARNPIQLRQLQQQILDSISETDKNIKEENAKIQSSIDEIAKLNEQINQMKLGTSEKKDVQTFKFVADALGVSLDNVARWFIVFIIFVFDPLAICLILAYNVAVYKKEDDSVYDNDSNSEEKIQKEEDVKAPQQLSQLLNEINPTINNDESTSLLKSNHKKENNATENSVKKTESNFVSDFFRSYFKKY